MNPVHLRIVGVVRRVLASKSIKLDKSDEEFLGISLGDLELDSIDKLDLIMALEECFDVVFTTSDVLKCDSVTEIGEHVDRAQRLAQAFL